MSILYPTSLKRKLPYVTVSAKGLSNGLSSIPNDGADFGPDTLLNATAPHQYGPPYTQTAGIQEAVNYVAGIGGGKIVLESGTYEITSTGPTPITVPTGNIIITGSGKKNTIINTPYGAFLFQSSTGAPTSNIELSNMTINITQGTTSTRGNHFLIAFSQGVLENVRLRHLYLTGGNNNNTGVGLIWNTGSAPTSVNAKNILMDDIYLDTGNAPNGNEAFNTSVLWTENFVIKDSQFANGNGPAIGFFAHQGGNIKIIRTKTFPSVLGNSSYVNGAYITMPGSGVSPPIQLYAIDCEDLGISTDAASNVYYNIDVIIEGGRNVNFSEYESGVTIHSLTIRGTHYRNSSIFYGNVYITGISAYLIDIDAAVDEVLTGPNYPIVLYPPYNTTITEYVRLKISGPGGQASSRQFINIVPNTSTNIAKYIFDLDIAYPTGNLVNLLTSTQQNYSGETAFHQFAAANPDYVLLIKGRVIDTYNQATGTLSLSSPTVPASGTAQQNTNPFAVEVALYGGTVTQITITRNGTTYTVFSNSSGAALSGQTYRLDPGDSITLTYSSAPTWTWLPA